MFIMEAHNSCQVVEKPHIISPPWPINNLISSIYKFGFQCFLVVNQIAYKKVLMFGDVVLAPSFSITKHNILSRTWCWQLMNCGARWPLLLNIIWSLTITPYCFPVLTLVVSATIMLIESNPLSHSFSKSSCSSQLRCNSFCATFSANHSLWNRLNNTKRHQFDMLVHVWRWEQKLKSRILGWH